MSEVTVFLRVTRSDGYMLRAARAEDEDAITALCARAWPHGEDYVPDAWADWLADSEGALIVAERGGEVAAVAKISFLAPHEGWLEGLRVDPAHRCRGLAGWILEVCLARAHEMGAAVVRLGTGGSNIAVHKTAARQGMARVAAFAYYSAQPLPAVEPAVLAPGDLAAVRELLDTSPALQAAAGLCETYWCWPELTDERLADAVAAGQAFAVRGGAGRLAALALVQGSRPAEQAKELVIGLLAGEGAALEELARGLRALAARVGAPEVEGKLPEWAPLRAAVEAAGYARDEEYDVWVYEKRWRQSPSGEQQSGLPRPRHPSAGRRSERGAPSGGSGGVGAASASTQDMT